MTVDLVRELVNWIVDSLLLLIFFSKVPRQKNGAACLLWNFLYAFSGAHLLSHRDVHSHFCGLHNCYQNFQLFGVFALLEKYRMESQSVLCNGGGFNYGGLSNAIDEFHIQRCSKAQRSILWGNLFDGHKAFYFFHHNDSNQIDHFFMDAQGNLL